MSQTLGRVLSLVGIAFLAHSAFSTYERKLSPTMVATSQYAANIQSTDLSYLNAVDKVESGLPIEITAECLMAVAVALVGIVLCSGDLKNILMENEMTKQTIDKLDTAPSFITFNHRGRRAVSAHTLLQRRSHGS
ncbi:hypothetical protein INT43_006964 [Umbelopsis isabellina]|uniref:Membrane magnesium transporter n=1 Tax=Mortierella isabellina TaxID=91625 RepID=A0A8H7PYA7_MORIS|nr:hypothetical protein INT43_006964 [Umbelopsis isabellina]